MIYRNDDELQRDCAEWQKRLRLQDWIVKPMIARARELESNNCGGECEWNLRLKTAVIRILSAVDYPDNLIFEQDMEQTLVHELLHLHFAPLFASTEDKSIECAQEQAIESIAGALVQLKRANEGSVKGTVE